MSTAAVDTPVIQVTILASPTSRTGRLERGGWGYVRGGTSGIGRGCSELVSYHKGAEFHSLSRAIADLSRRHKALSLRETVESRLGHRI